MKTEILNEVSGRIDQVYQDLEYEDVDDGNDDSSEADQSSPGSRPNINLENKIDSKLKHQGAVTKDSFKSLAEEFSIEEKVGPEIDADLADIVNSLLKEKLSKEKILEVQNKYPKTNKQVWQQLKQETRNTDSTIQRAQSYLMSGLQAVLQVCNITAGKDKQMLTHAIVSLLTANRDLNIKRRDFIRPDLNKQYASLCSPSTSISTLLFGDDLKNEVEDLTKSNKLSNKVTLKQRFEPYATTRGRGRSCGRGRSSARWRGSRPTRSFLGVGRGQMRSHQTNPMQQRFNRRNC
jgi:hypothetical protein